MHTYISHCEISKRPGQRVEIKTFTEGQKRDLTHMARNQENIRLLKSNTRT